MSGFKQVIMPWLIDSNGAPIGVKESDGDETFIPRFSADQQSLLKPDGSALAGTGGGYVLPVATAATLGGVKAGSGVTIASDGTLSASGGGGGGSAADDIAFSTTVPLLNTAGSYMAGVQSVAGALTFTPAANAVRGAFTFAYLKANGVNIPDVSAFTEHGGSMGYLNTANILNIAQFFNLAGVNWVSWSQAAAPVAITTPTTVTMAGPTSGVINTASSNYTVGTDGTRASSVVVTPTPVANVTFTPSSVTLPAGTATATFTATSTTTGAKTIAVTNNGSLSNPANITLTVAAAATAPGAPTIGAATGGDTTMSQAGTAPASDGGSAITGYQLKVYKASDDSLVGTFTNATLPVSATGLTNGTAVYGKLAATNAVGTGAQSAASNNVTPAAAIAYPRLSPRDAAFVESGSGPYGYAANSAGFTSNRSVCNKSLAAGTDGSLAVTVVTGQTVLVGIQATAALTDFGSMTAYLYGTGAGNYTGGGAANTSVNTLTTEDGDIVRFRIVGTTAFGEVARAATPTTFVVANSWAGLSAAAIRYFGVASDNNATLSTLTAIGLV